MFAFPFRKKMRTALADKSVENYFVAIKIELSLIDSFFFFFFFSFSSERNIFVIDISMKRIEQDLKLVKFD